MAKNKLTAFAIKYPKDAYAPFITAKGEDVLAQRILQEAQKNNIPIKQSELAVDLLSAAEVGQLIPEDAWTVMAQIFSVILNKE